MTWLALPWFVLVTSGSPKQMSFVVAAEAGGFALFGIPSGTFLARVGARRAMLLGDAARAPLLALIPVLHSAAVLSLGALVTIAFTLGTLAAPYPAAQRVILPEILGEDESLIARASALLQGAVRITMLSGPPLAGVIIAAAGASIVLLIDAATYAAAFFLVLVFLRGGWERRASAPREESGLLGGLRYVASDRLLRAWTLGLTLSDAAFYVIFTGLPVLVIAHYGANPRLAGLLFASWGTAAAAGNVVSYRSIRRGLGGPAIAGLVMVQSLPLVLLAAPLPAAGLAGALAVSGFANGLVNPTLFSWLTLRPPPAMRAKVMTTTMTASSLGAPAALMLAGPAYDAYGSRAVLGAAGIATTVALALVGLVTIRVSRGDPLVPVGDG